MQMPGEHIPKQFFYELPAGKHSHGGQCKCIKYSLRVSLLALQINHASWEHASLECTSWNSLITRGAVVSQERCTVEVKRNCPQQKVRIASTSTTAASHICPTCGRHLHAQIGLSSHIWMHMPYTIQLGCQWSSLPMMDTYYHIDSMSSAFQET